MKKICSAFLLLTSLGASLFVPAYAAGVGQAAGRTHAPVRNPKTPRLNALEANVAELQTQMAAVAKVQAATLRVLEQQPKSPVTTGPSGLYSYP